MPFLSRFLIIYARSLFSETVPNVNKKFILIFSYKLLVVLHLNCLTSRSEKVEVNHTLIDDEKEIQVQELQASANKSSTFAFLAG